MITPYFYLGDELLLFDKRANARGLLRSFAAMIGGHALASYNSAYDDDTQPDSNALLSAADAGDVIQRHGVSVVHSADDYSFDFGCTYCCSR